MFKRSVLATSIAVGLASSFSAHAANIYDPRSLAMGGVGVTTATSRNASFFNPAALAATKETDDFAFNLTIAARAADPDKLVDDIDSVEDAGQDVSTALDNLNSSINAIINAGASLDQTQVDRGRDDAARVNSTLIKFNDELKKIDKKNVEVGAFGGVIVAIPSKKFGLGLYASGSADVGARFDYATSDQALLVNFAGVAGTTGSPTGTTIWGTLNACQVSTPTTCTDLANNADSLRDQITDADGDINDLQSKFNVRGAVVAEVGISLARRFPDWGNVDIGITPKMQKVQTFNYAISAQDTEFDEEKGKREGSAFNLDVGVTKTYGESYKAGFVIKNLLSKEFDFAGTDPANPTANATDKFKIKPQARLGVSHHTNWTTVGLDIDLTKNQALGSGFSKESRFVGIGAELDLAALDIRVGYKHDLTGNYDSVPSVGFGLYIFGFHIDAGVAGDDKNVAASVQIGLNF